MVDWAERPGGVGDLGRGVIFWWDEGPEGFVLGALFDPFFEKLFFFFGEWFGVAVLGRHGVIGVVDALPGFGVCEGVRFDGLDAIFEGVGAFGGVESESGFAAWFAVMIGSVVGSVAHDAFGREDGADVLIERNFILTECREG